MTLLLVILALLGGFVFGIYCAALGIKKHYKAAWLGLMWEIKANKLKRADAAREKEARP